MGSVPTLRGERLTLREFDPADEGPLHAFVSDPEVTHLTTLSPNTPADTRAFLDDVTDIPGHKGSYNLTPQRLAA